GRRQDVLPEAVALLRAAEAAGRHAITGPLRIELAAAARAAGLGMSGVSAVHPVLTGAAAAGGSLRAAALLQVVACMAPLGWRGQFDDAVAEADHLYAEDTELESASALALRGSLRAFMAAQYRRRGDLASALAAGAEGLDLLAEAAGSAADTAHARCRLTLELVLVHLDRGEHSDALSLAEPVLAAPARATEFGARGWLELALATRIHLPDGELDCGERLLRQIHATTRRPRLLAESAGALAGLCENGGHLADALSFTRSARAAEHAAVARRDAARAALLEEFPGSDPTRAEVIDALLTSASGGGVRRAGFSRRRGRAVDEAAPVTSSSQAAAPATMGGVTPPSMPAPAAESDRARSALAGLALPGGSGRGRGAVEPEPEAPSESAEGNADDELPAGRHGGGSGALATQQGRVRSSSWGGRHATPGDTDRDPLTPAPSGHDAPAPGVRRVALGVSDDVPAAARSQETPSAPEPDEVPQVPEPSEVPVVPEPDDVPDVPIPECPPVPPAEPSAPEPSANAALASGGGQTATESPRADLGLADLLAEALAAFHHGERADSEEQRAALGHGRHHEPEPEYAEYGDSRDWQPRSPETDTQLVPGESAGAHADGSRPGVQWRLSDRGLSAG
ncbi:MAG: hypothetical protein ACRDSS_11535, partial [Actinocrinis sp.]